MSVNVPYQVNRIRNNEVAIINGLLRIFFEEIERQVMEHMPTEVTAMMTANEIRYDVRGIRCSSDPASLTFRVDCRCGRMWSV